jgi:hypothetical protein
MKKVQLRPDNLSWVYYKELSSAAYSLSVEQARCDDCESLVYVLTYFCNAQGLED